MSEEIGFIYIMRNLQMPGLYKIGHTARSPVSRAQELSGYTACPGDFSVLWSHEVFRPAEVEAELHRILASKRVNPRREFFRLGLDDLVEAAEYCAEVAGGSDLEAIQFHMLLGKRLAERRPIVKLQPSLDWS